MSACPRCEVREGFQASSLLVDSAGKILAVDSGWRRFFEQSQSRVKMPGVGDSFLAVCDQSARLGCDDAAAAAGAMRDVLHGRAESSLFEFPCETPRGRLWLGLEIQPVLDSCCGALVVYRNIGVAAAASVDTQGFEDVLDAAFEGVAWIRPDGSVSVSNPAFQGLFGCAAGESGPESWLDLFPASEHSRLFEALGQLGDGRVVPVAVTGQHRNGGRFPITMRLMEQTAGAGARDGFICVAMAPDSGAQRPPARYPAASEAQFAILDSIPDAVLICGQNGIVRRANRAAGELFGRRPEEFAGMPVDGLGPSIGGASLYRLLQQWESWRNCPVILRRADESVFAAFLHSGAASLGSEAGQVLTFRTCSPDTLSEVPAFRSPNGWVTICASCRRVRSKSGFWQAPEILSQGKEKLRISHSVCPECMKILYPDFLPGVSPT